MKIKQKHKDEPLRLSDLQPGDCFRLSTSTCEHYVVAIPGATKMLGISSKEVWVMGFRSNTVCLLDRSLPVHRVTAHVVIE